MVGEVSSRPLLRPPAQVQQVVNIRGGGGRAGRHPPVGTDKQVNLYTAEDLVSCQQNINKGGFSMWEMTGRKLTVMMMLIIRSDIIIMTLGSWLDQRRF